MARVSFVVRFCSSCGDLGSRETYDETRRSCSDLSTDYCFAFRPGELFGTATLRREVTGLKASFTRCSCSLVSSTVSGDDEYEARTHEVRSSSSPIISEPYRSSEVLWTEQDKAAGADMIATRIKDHSVALRSDMKNRERWRILFNEIEAFRPAADSPPKFRGAPLIAFAS